MWRAVRTFLVAFLLGLGVSSLATPLVLRFARARKLFDVPDGARKIHARAIPRLGGVAITAGFVVPLLAVLFAPNRLGAALHADTDRLIAFIVGMAGIVGLGIVDDLKGVGAWGKLSVQATVGVVLWWGGLSFDQITVLDHPIELGVLSLPFTIIWVAALVNAMNLIDGLDGLAAGVAFFAAFSLFTIALIDNNAILALFAAALAGSVLGFLLYNFSPALIFMGDTGSMTIGYIFAACALWSTSKRSTALSLLLPVVALGVPVLDTLFAFARRALTGRSPFSSDRGHIHHRLLDVGMTQGQAVLALYTVCVVLSVGAIVIRTTDDLRYGGVLIALLGALAAVSRTFRSQILRSREAETSVPTASTPEDAHAALPDVGGGSGASTGDDGAASTGDDSAGSDDGDDSDGRS
jgi:UDP-GlcNAc:undecaprenyl-phosphate/decaprenyl-phosphate GlcNAc-1-phosphate transferase